MDETKAGLLADLRAKRDHYNAVEGNDDSMEHLLEALDAFLDAPAPSQPTPEARVEWEGLLREAAAFAHKVAAAATDTAAKMAMSDGYDLYLRITAALARRSAPTGQQQEAGAAPPAAPKHEEWCALYGDPEKGESCDCAAAPPSAPQEGLFKEGWEAGREAAAAWHDIQVKAIDNVARCASDNAAYLGSADYQKIARHGAAAAAIRALPLPESALLTKAAPLTQPAVPEKEQENAGQAHERVSDESGVATGHDRGERPEGERREGVGASPGRSGCGAQTAGHGHGTRAGGAGRGGEAGADRRSAGSAGAGQREHAAAADIATPGAAPREGAAPARDCLVCPNRAVRGLDVKGGALWCWRHGPFYDSDLFFPQRAAAPAPVETRLTEEES